MKRRGCQKPLLVLFKVAKTVHTGAPYVLRITERNVDLLSLNVSSHIADNHKRPWIPSFAEDIIFGRKTMDLLHNRVR